MRRKEKEITDKSEIIAMIRNARVCRLAMVDDGAPYVVPLSFGFSDDTLYFHSAPMGRKIDVLGKNNRVCFEFDEANQLERGETACKWGMHFRSIIGFGTATFVTDPDAKRRALDVIMSQYADPGQRFTYPDANLKATTVIKVDIDRMTGKRS